VIRCHHEEWPVHPHPGGERVGRFLHHPGPILAVVFSGTAAHQGGHGGGTAHGQRGGAPGAEQPAEAAVSRAGVAGRPACEKRSLGNWPGNGPSVTATVLFLQGPSLGGSRWKPGRQQDRRLAITEIAEEFSAQPKLGSGEPGATFLAPACWGGAQVGGARAAGLSQEEVPWWPRLRPGYVHPAPQGATRTKTFRIYRWNPEDGQNPRVDAFTTDLDQCGPMVRDGLIYIKNHVDSTLAFRRLCIERSRSAAGWAGNF
jgi:hypothetical protein